MRWYTRYRPIVNARGRMRSFGWFDAAVRQNVRSHRAARARCTPSSARYPTKMKNTHARFPLMAARGGYAGM
jgi:hypothetical protein